MKDNKQPGPVRDAAGRFGLILRRGAGRLYPASLLCCLGFLPAFLLVWLGVASWQFWISLLGGALGGLLGAQVLCGLFDTVFRVLRGDKTPWKQSYAMAWKQNWKDALLPGALAGGFLGLWAWVVMELPQMTDVPGTVWLCMAVGWFFLLGLFTYVFAQLVLVRLSFGRLMKNAAFLFMGFLPRTLAATAIQGVYWAAVLIPMPYTLPVLLITGFWLPAAVALAILYPLLDQVFHLDGTAHAGDGTV